MTTFWERLAASGLDGAAVGFGVALVVLLLTGEIVVAVVVAVAAAVAVPALIGWLVERRKRRQRA